MGRGASEGVEPEPGWDPLRHRAGAGGPCAYCRESLPWDGALACRRCGVIYHPDCWKANASRCAVYGCEPAPAPARAPAPPRIPARVLAGTGTSTPSSWGRYSWVLVVAAVSFVRYFVSSPPSYPYGRPVPTFPEPRPVRYFDSLPRPRRAWGADAPRIAVVPSRGSSPDAVQLHARSVALAEEGNWSEALAEESRALELDPGFAAAWTGRAAIRVHLRDYEGALADGDRTVALDPSSAEAFEVRSRARAGKGDTRGAEEDLSSAIRLRPTAEAYVRRGELRKDQRRDGPALEDFARAIDLDPRQARAHHLRAHLWETLGNPKSAYVDFEIAARLAPGDAEIHDDLGMALRGRGEPGAAVAEVSRALEIDPVYGCAYLHRGALRYDAGDLAGALEDFRKGLRYDAARGSAPLFWIWLVRVRLDERASANWDLADAFRGRLAGPRVSPDAKLAGYLIGSRTEGEVVGALEEGDPRELPGRECRAFFFIGAHHLLAGDDAGARGWFEKSVARGQRSLDEWWSASAALGRPR